MLSKMVLSAGSQKGSSKHSETLSKNQLVSRISLFEHHTQTETPQTRTVHGHWCHVIRT